MNEYAITFDIDWASDEVIDYVAQKLISKNIRATWFITHDSAATRRLFEHPSLFEIGWHPNFMSGSTHGDTPEKVMDHMRSIYPDAVSVRTHGLFQSSNLLKMMRDKYNIEIDSSIFLPYTANIAPHTMYYYQSKNLVRLPYFWADYTEVNVPGSDFSFDNPKYSVEGLKIFNFHPIHIALNSSRLENYFNLKASHPVETSGMDVIKKYRNENDKGAETILDEIIRLHAANGGLKTLKELMAGWVQKSKV